MHLMRLLLDLVPVILVECGQVLGSGYFAAIVSLDHRFSRSLCGRAFGEDARWIFCVQMSHHLELHKDLPEGKNRALVCGVLRG